MRPNQLRVAIAVRFLAGISLTVSIQAQQSASPREATMPRLVQFNGIVKEAAGKPVAGVAFALYKDQEGGAPVWMETQNVALDESGRYSVLLGATRNEGLPQELLTS